MNVLLPLVALLTIGRTSNYRIRDPESGHVDHTDDTKALDGAAVRFTDAQTGNEVTIQDSAVDEISGDEFNIRRCEASVPAGQPGGETK